MVRKSRAIHKNNKDRIFKLNSLIYNNKNIRNAWPKSPSLTVRREDLEEFTIFVNYRNHNNLNSQRKMVVSHIPSVCNLPGSVIFLALRNAICERSPIKIQWISAHSKNVIEKKMMIKTQKFFSRWQYGTRANFNV